MANAPQASRSSAGGIVIVGGGLAGLFTALKLAPLPVTVIAGAPLGEGASSVWAQGGIAAAVGEGDTPEAHARDTIAAGAGIVDEDIARMVAGEAAERIRDLLRFGVPFDRDLEGHFQLSREAAHSASRVVRVSGDRAGAAIMQALIATARKTASIRILEGYEALGLVSEGGTIRGVRAAKIAAGKAVTLEAAAVVLATGGLGQLYEVTTNPVNSRGQGLAMAARAGAVIRDAEFVQFHPTAIDIGADPAPLASEALRGEGAVLVNRAGTRFMVGQHPDAELAPRDVVARGVFREIKAGRGAFLDCRTAIGRHFGERFPTITEHCRKAGIDPVRDLIPVAPAEHFHMGGVETDRLGRTSLAGLWAVGEVASTGLHGANRLASNSLLEAVVFGDRVARDVQERCAGAGAAAIEEAASRDEPGPGPGTPATTAELRRTMSREVGVERDAAGLARALGALVDLSRRAASDRRLADSVLAAQFIAAAALEREESRGGHFRTDHPAPRAEWARHSRWTCDELDGFLRRRLPDLAKKEPRR